MSDVIAACRTDQAPTQSDVFALSKFFVGKFTFLVHDCLASLMATKMTQASLAMTNHPQPRKEVNDCALPKK